MQSHDLEQSKHQNEARAADLTSEDDRRSENRRIAVFLGIALAVSGIVALFDFGLFLWTVEIGFLATCLGVYAFSGSVRRFTGDRYALSIGVNYFFTFFMSFAFTYRAVSTGAAAVLLAPTTMYLWVCAAWYQAFTFLVLTRIRADRVPLTAVMAIDSAVALILILLYAAVPTLREFADRGVMAAYRAVNSAAFCVFYAIVIIQFFRRRREFPAYFANRTIASMIGSAISVVGILASMEGPRPAVFASWFVQFVAVYLCYKATVSYALLDPFRRLNRSLSARAAELTEANARLNAAVEERDVLLGEVHHRVKNNMQVLSSLLNLQSSRTEDWSTKSALLDSQRRIRTMAVVHEKLYHDGVYADIDFKEYISSLVSEICLGSAKEGIACRLEGDEVRTKIEVAIPSGLIVSELVANALKHAFPDGRRGKIEVSLRKLEEGSVELAVADDGVGMPQGFDPATSGSMGLSLVHALASQLRGTLSLNGAPGTRAVVTFRP